MNNGRFRILKGLDSTARAATVPQDDEICRDPGTGQIYVGVSGAWVACGGSSFPPLEDLAYDPGTPGDWDTPPSDPVTALDVLAARATDLETTQLDKGLFEAKGDILVAAGDSDPARLPAGTNGHVLTADSSQTLGVKWAAATGGGGGAETIYAFTGSTVDCADGFWQTKTLTADLTPTVSNHSSGRVLVLFLTASGADRTFNKPSGHRAPASSFVIPSGKVAVLTDAYDGTNHNWTWGLVIA